MEADSATVRLLVFIFVCSVSRSAAVLLRHNENFNSGLILTCDDGLFTLDSGVSFQRNGINIPREGDGGTLGYPLSQENEGNFTCTHGGQTSPGITLAAVPPRDFPLHRPHYVLVPVNGAVSTQLTCDIGPGAARESYSVVWKRLNSDGSFASIEEGISQENFSLTLPVNANSNNAVYRCTVTIHHDGTGHLSYYDGANITIITAVEPPHDFPLHRSHYVLVPVHGTVSTQLVCDIGPGTAREVQWSRLNADDTFTPVTEGINQENFNLTLPVSVDSNGTVYRCTVTIDLGGNLRSYHGANITVRTAAEPPLDFPSHRSHYVLLPVRGEVSTQLGCDIGPGAGRRVKWDQLNPDGSITPITEGISQQNFYLTLSVNINSNGTVCMCTVTIEYGGNLLRTYHGARNTLETAVEAQIVRNVSSHPPLPVGQPVSFSCEATGDSLVFLWLFERQVYRHCPEHDNFCVQTNIARDVIGVASGQSRLSIRDTALLSPSDSSMSFSVVCQVTQNIPSQFRPQPKSSEARLVLNVEEESDIQEDNAQPLSEKNLRVVIIAAAIFGCLLAAAITIICVAYLRTKRPKARCAPDGITEGHIGGDDGDKELAVAQRSDAGGAQSLINRVFRFVHVSRVLHYDFQFGYRLTPPQLLQTVLQSVHGLLSRSSHSGQIMRFERPKNRHLSQEDEEAPNSAPEGASGSGQDSQVLV